MNKKETKAAQDIFEKFQGKSLTTDDVKKAEKKAKNLKDKMKDFKLLLKMIKDVWDGKFSIGKKDMAILVGAVLYVVSPIDAIPDFIPVIGWIDDIAVVGWAMNSLSNVISEYKVKMGLD